MAPFSAWQAEDEDGDEEKAESLTTWFSSTELHVGVSAEVVDSTVAS